MNTTWQSYLRFYPEPCRTLPTLDEEWLAWRGMDIHVDRLARPSPVKLILVHGAGAYGRVLLPLVAPLDVETIAPDLPGYGLTRTNGHVVEYQDWVDVLSEVVRRERERDARPIVLFGASMGGMLAYNVAGREKVDGLVVTCFLDPRSEAVRNAITRFGWLERASRPLLDAGTFDRLEVPVRWLTKMSRMANDPEVGALCSSDALGGGAAMPLRWVRTFLASVPPIEPERFDRCPVLLAHPANDTWTPIEVSLPFFDRLAGEKTLTRLAGAGHFPLEPAALLQLEATLRTFLASLS